MRARVALAAAALLGCAGAPLPALEGRIWDARAGAFVSEDALVERLRAARFRLLGEVHDHPEHHRLRARLVARLGADRPRVYFEQFDRENDARLVAAQRPGADADAVARAGGIDPGWRWPLHRPIVRAALEAGLEVRAANLPREDARRIASGAALPGAVLDGAPWSEADEADLRGEILAAHCGALPERAAGPMALAQRARDAALAAALQAAPGPAILIAGNGHVRRDRGVPRYLRAPGEAVSVGFLEVEDGGADPRALAAGVGGPAYDFVWFTAPHPRPDPCEAFRTKRRSS